MKDFCSEHIPPHTSKHFLTSPSTTFPVAAGMQALPHWGDISGCVPGGHGLVGMVGIGDLIVLFQP